MQFTYSVFELREYFAYIYINKYVRASEQASVTGSWNRDCIEKKYVRIPLKIYDIHSVSIILDTIYRLFI